MKKDYIADANLFASLKKLPWTGPTHTKVKPSAKWTSVRFPDGREFDREDCEISKGVISTPVTESEDCEELATMLLKLQQITIEPPEDGDGHRFIRSRVVPMIERQHAKVRDCKFYKDNGDGGFQVIRAYPTKKDYRVD